MPQIQKPKEWKPKLHTDLMHGHLAWTEGHDDPGLYHFRTAHEYAATAAKRLIDAREAALANQMNTRPANLRGYALTRKQAEKRALELVQSALDRGRKEVEQVRSILESPIAQPSNAQTASEIRTYMRGLSREERTGLLAKAVEAGDTETVSATLAAPGYLSGLKDAEVSHYRTQWQRARNPEAWQRLQTLEKAQETAARAGERLVDLSIEIDAADGAELRDAVASEQAAQDAWGDL